MSKIITPVDIITITIDNRTNPAKAGMQVSRDLPLPLVCQILAQLIAGSMQEMQKRIEAQEQQLVQLMKQSSPGKD